MRKREVCFWSGVYTSLSLVALFLFSSIFFPSASYEEQYLEVHNVAQNIDNFEFLDEQVKIDTQSRVQEILYAARVEQYYESLKNRFHETYIPLSYKNNFQEDHRIGIHTFFLNEYILRKLQNISIFHHQNSGVSRGKMKSGKIHLYKAQDMTPAEYLAVAIHEFGHFHDIHIFSSNIFGDMSSSFYDISWEDTYDMKQGQEYMDFVSGYSMTNKYEDFAEAYTFFLLHNTLFEKKAEKSHVLRKKYDFFQKHIDIPMHPDISLEEEIKYHWDSTKILYDYEKFLQYYKSDI